MKKILYFILAISLVFAPVLGYCEIRVDGVDAGAGGSTSPGGADKQVQYNDDGSFGGEAGFEYNDATNTLTVPILNVTGNSTFDSNSSMNLSGTTYMQYNTSGLSSRLLFKNSGGTGVLEMGLRQGWDQAHCIISSTTTSYNLVMIPTLADMGLSASSNPHFWIFSANGAGENINFEHDQTDGVIDVNTGDIKLNDQTQAVAGVIIGADSTNNLLDDSSNGSSTTPLYIGNASISTAFTAKHYYQLGDMDLTPGEVVSLINGKIYRSKDSQDKKAIGIYWGLSNFEDSLGNCTAKYKVKEKEVSYIERKEVPNDQVSFIDTGSGNIMYIRTVDNSSVILNEETGTFYIDEELTKIVMVETKEIEGTLSHAVAVLGDSYEKHNKNPLNGAYVTIKAGKIENGDYLCASDKAGYLEKQADDVVHNYTVAIAREDINEDTQNAYIYLLQ